MGCHPKTRYPLESPGRHTGADAPAGGRASKSEGHQWQRGILPRPKRSGSAGWPTSTPAWHPSPARWRATSPPPPSSENRLAQTLIELEPLGYTLLADRRWPGSARANVDLILVGPGGVDHRRRQGLARGHRRAGHVFRGQADVTDEIEQLADLVFRAQTGLAEIGLAAGEVSAMAAFTNKVLPRAELFGVTLLGEAAAVTEIARRGTRLTAEQIARVRTELDRLFPPHDHRADRRHRAGRHEHSRAGAACRHPRIVAHRLLVARQPHDAADPDCAARGHPQGADRGVDGVPRSRAGPHRAPQLQRPVAHPRSRGNRQDRRRPAPRRATSPAPWKAACSSRPTSARCRR